MDKILHAVVVTHTIDKYVIHQVHDALGHNNNTRTFQCLKELYYWKGVRKDVHAHVK